MLKVVMEPLLVTVLLVMVQPTLQLKKATLQRMEPKVMLLKQQHQDNLNRDTWQASLALTLPTQLSLVMECLQPHNPVMGICLREERMVLDMVRFRAKKHHQIHQRMVSLNSHHLKEQVMLHLLPVNLDIHLFNLLLNQVLLHMELLLSQVLLLHTELLLSQVLILKHTGHHLQLHRAIHSNHTMVVLILSLLHIQLTIVRCLLLLLLNLLLNQMELPKVHLKACDL